MAKVVKRRLRDRAQPRDIPQRDLRNDISRILAAVERGEHFRVTVRGKPVAEIGPVTTRRMSVPWAEVMEILRRRPADTRLMAEVDGAVDNTIRDPWKQFSTPRS